MAGAKAAGSLARLGETGALQRYRDKRNFTVTPEPADTADAAAGEQLAYVIQKHDATRLHYDFRLELDGVLLSWAVPKGPSLDPATKRMAVRTEDHPLAYAGFEGTIPPKQYGAGTVIVWDRGSWTPVGDPRAGLAAGKLAFELHGDKLQGLWELVRMAKKPDERQEAWLLFKKRDAHARTQADYDIVTALPDSVLRHPPPPAPAPAPETASADDTPTGPLPATLSPQLALLATAVPEEGRWIYETKFDGYRLMVRIEGGVPRLITRGGHDWTDKMPVLAKSLAGLGADNAWLDGEIVVGGAAGTGDFNALQNAFDRARGVKKSSTQAIEYRVFDLPWFEGHDLRDAPLYARRELLQQWLAAHAQPHVTMSEALGDGTGALAPRLLQQACKAGLEGLIAKRADAPYRSTRSPAWLKLKCHQRQEFVVGGYTERSDDARAVGSLVLGVHDSSGHLGHAGSVGTGWNQAAARDLLARLEKLRVQQSPFEAGAQAAGRWGRRGAGLERWVRPSTVVEVSFAEWTPAGHVRHAVFMGVRSDKPARAIGRERPASPETLMTDAAPPAPTPAAARAAARKTAAATGTLAGIKVTHGERVVDAASGHTKLDLVRYYDSMADFILPHLKGRVVALVRGPGGVDGQLFFQKHGEKIGIPGIRELDPELWPGHAALLEVATRQALLGAAQMNVIEFHTWNSTVKNVAKPDRMIFDLDPGEGVAWPAIQEGALLTRALLQELGLLSWLKTSGGKGLHVVVPLSPRLDYDTVKAFSKAVVEHLSRTIPERFVAKSGPANRKGRIFVDYLRNGEGATTVAAFSARARPGLGVSVPVDWDELKSLRSAAQWTISDARDRLSLLGADPWADMAAAKQTLTKAVKALGFKPPG